jgi:acetylornithine/N-succinyldiaminopimelate aminotransferase
MKTRHLIWSTGHELILNDIVNASNCELSDSKGNKYVDLESGVWCTSVGHCNPRINAVIASQINKIIHTGFNYCNPITEIAAEEILGITNMPQGKCEFLCSGSEAVEFCVRASKQIEPDAMLLTFSDSYFGAYGEATKTEGKEWYRYNWQECSCVDKEDGCCGECKEFSEIPFGKIGIFLFEPGSSSGLVRFPSKKLIEKIANKIRENNGVIVVNEVTTGVGRTGKWFGFQHYNLKPDMVAIGKGIGNGYPVSVAAISGRAVNLLKTQHIHYSQSHQNDPLGASIVKEVISTISDEKLIERSFKLGKKIMSELEDLKNSCSIIKAIRGRGLMIAVEFTKDAEFIHKELIKRGFIVAKRPGNEVIRIDPALTVAEKDINSFLDNLKEIITYRDYR